MSDDNKDKGFFDMLDKAVSFYEENRDTIENVVSEGDGVQIDDDGPLKAAVVNEDEAKITVDVGKDNLQDIEIKLNGTTAVLVIGSNTITAEVPEDVIMDDASAELNNGVLNVQIPREGGAS